MYDYDDIVTAVTFRINGLATQDVLSHIHNVFSDKIAASAKNIPELGEGEKWSIKNNFISIRKDTKNSNYIVRTRTQNKLAVQMGLIMFQGSDTKLTIGSDSIGRGCGDVLPFFCQGQGRLRLAWSRSLLTEKAAAPGMAKTALWLINHSREHTRAYVDGRTHSHA